MKSTKVLAVITALFLLVGSGMGISRAQGITGSAPSANVSTAFTYQGQLNKDGSPVNDTCAIQYSLWDAAQDGNQVGNTVAHAAVNISGGLFTDNLDFGNAAFTGEARWLQVAVQCSGDADYVTLAPRQPLTAAPYALSLRPGAWIRGSTSTGLGVWTDSAVNSSTALLADEFSTSGATQGIVGRVRSTDDNAIGVKGVAEGATGTTYGVYGKNDSPSGYGVYGESPLYGVAGLASATTGYNVGVRGLSDSTGGWGVAGIANATTGVNYGVGGVTASPDGFAVYGSNSATTGNAYGVYGLSTSTDGRAVVGWTDAITGSTMGVYGHAQSPDGRGVYGGNSATAGTAYGVRGVTYSTGGQAVSGNASADNGTTYGVWGTAASSTGTGVYGQALDAECSTSTIPSDIACSGVRGNSADGFGTLGWTADGVALGAHVTGSGTALGLYSEQGTGDFIVASRYIFGSDTEFRVANDGNVYADGTFHTPAADMAEMLPAADGLEPGDVLCVGLDGKLARCTRPYQASTVGVYSSQPGFVGGSVDEAEADQGKVPLAVVGIVPVKASAENGPIQPGDLLVAGSIPGHAMRAGDQVVAGTMIGKALEGLDQGTGVILMLVVLQ